MMLARRALMSVIVAAASLPATAALAGGSVRAKPLAAALAAARTTAFTLAPAPDRAALAQVRFPQGAPRGLSAANLRIAPSGPFGNDYLVLATLAHHGSGAGRALVLLVNRPSPLPDPARVALRLRSAPALGAARLRSTNDVFVRTPSPTSAALCSALGSRPLAAGAVRVLSTRGAPLSGISAAGALAAGYDAACGLTYPPAFRQAVTSEPKPAPPSEPKPVPQPGPKPEPPHCPPCAPKPGYACPFDIAPHACPAVAAGRPAAPTAH